MPIYHKSTLILILLAICLLLPTCTTSSESEDKNWELIWSDEFEGPEGTSPDSANWIFDTWGNESGWGNAQLEYNTDRPQNVSHDGAGNLAIIAREEPYGGLNYTSARITTLGKYDVTYGRVESRIKLPYGQGMWPAFWMLGTDHMTTGWPQCGEIDIMEFRGQNPDTIHGTLHGPGYSGGQSIGEAFTLNNQRFDTDFYIFAIEWDAESIEWYVGDQLYSTLTPSDLTGDWVYDHPFYLILNLAVGGHFVGSPNENTRFPQTMLVDYVRVYQDAN